MGEEEGGEYDEDRFVRSLFPCYEMSLEKMLERQFDLVYFSGFSYSELDRMSSVEFRFFYARLAKFFKEKIYPSVIAYGSSGDGK